MFTFCKSSVLAVALTCSLLAAAPPAFCGEERPQGQLLNQLFSKSEPEWLPILKDHTELLDQTFFQRVDERVRWCAESNQIDDAIRFAMVGDFACTALGVEGGYRLGLANWFLRAGNDTLARPLIENILLTNPEVHAARYIRAAYRRNEGDFVGAREDYEKLIAAGHRVADAHAGLGMIATVLQKWNEARDDFRAALAVTPEHPIATEALARIDSRSVPAAAPFSEVEVVRGLDTPDIVVDPKLFALYLRQAETALKANRLREAELGFKKAVMANPADGTPRIQLGALYYRMGHLSDALFFINAGLGLAPENVDGWRFAGCAFERRFDLSGKPSDLANAKIAYTRTLELHPGDAVAQMGLERLQRKNPGNVRAQ
jgi:tetratricopeptide (TPR) repeat protein